MNRPSGLFAFLSYRDPHLEETIDVYRNAVEDVCGIPFHAEELEKAVIGTIGALDRPLDPAGRGYTALIRDFSGLTDSAGAVSGRRCFVMPGRLQETARSYFPASADGGLRGLRAGGTASTGQRSLSRRN